MLIYTLAATMTLTMLIATAFGLRREAQRVTARKPDLQRPRR